MAAKWRQRSTSRSLGLYHVIKKSSQYFSFAVYIPEELKQTFVEECSIVGIDAKRVQCFSSNPGIREYLSILVERGQKFAPYLLKVLNLLQSKSKIRIEVAADRKIIDLQGVSVDDALKLIQAADAIRVIDQQEPEDMNSDSAKHTI
ncbi:TPA: hypothetical protein ACG0AS_002645 [Enterobacter hormaechei subsp. hoffmannii]|uniref:Uncharacterized protein n=2 Tax=Enterobacter hormaechei TaxID=158836 RepID=A0AAI9GF35_9ENTR|nr:MULTISPECIES: hypothetical protein [Enterobacter]EHF4957501.1 hypothetical protein [Enterobacter hormaechei]EHF4973196.1 hypothetical protein [Enterobacter hormaechei]EHF5012075.1 hypothetical protein [Enterobacter hormaechei]EHF5021857.1 hypothetical protein [Enterobacter hormaechei]EHF5046639.1 hypothetical protein [Enterobacter hormaechei]